MTGDRQVQQVKIRLLLPTLLATMRQRGLDADELSLVLDLFVERHGLQEFGIVERWLDAHYWNWKRDPRMTLVEYVRTEMAKGGGDAHGR